MDPNSPYSRGNPSYTMSPGQSDVDKNKMRSSASDIDRTSTSSTAASDAARGPRASFAAQSSTAYHEHYSPYSNLSDSATGANSSPYESPYKTTPAAPYDTAGSRQQHSYKNGSSAAPFVSPVRSHYDVDTSSSVYASPSTAHPIAGLRQRRSHISSVPASPDVSSPYIGRYDDKDERLKRKIVRNLDFFPKIEKDMTVSTERGGMITLISYAVIVLLALAELGTWVTQNTSTSEHVVVETG